MHDFNTNGYFLINLEELQYLEELRDLLEKELGGQLAFWHLRFKGTKEEWVSKVYQLSETLWKSRLFQKHFEANKSFLMKILGPNLDMQSKPHFRLTRPENENDQFGWHRDSYYGAKPWEIAVWTPLGQLSPGAGFQLIKGSHLKDGEEIRHIEEDDSFRRSVKKGSKAHKIGFIYAPKTEKYLDEIKEEDIIHLQPNFGQCVVFPKSALHRGINRSENTRISFDTSFKPAFTQTNSRDEYYYPLSRNGFGKTVEQFQESAEIR